MIRHKARIPEELEDFIANITDSEDDQTEPIRVTESPNVHSHRTIPV